MGCSHRPIQTPIVGHCSALLVPDHRESELRNDFVCMLLLSKLDEGVVEVLEKGSKKKLVRLKICLPFDCDLARTHFLFEELTQVQITSCPW